MEAETRRLNAHRTPKGNIVVTMLDLMAKLTPDQATELRDQITDALEPLPAPSAPKIDEERWAYQAGDGEWVICANNIDPRRWEDGTSTRVRVLDVASYEAMMADLAETHRLSEIATEMDMRIASLTHERDEARESMAIREAHDRAVVGLVAHKDSRIAELEHALSEARASIVWQANVAELEQENKRLAEATRGDLERIAELERQLAEANANVFYAQADLASRVKNYAPPASGPDEGWVEKAWNQYRTFLTDRKETTCHDDFIDALRRHAPAQRYPEVCEVEKAMKDARWCFSWALERENEDGDPNFEWAVRNHWSSCSQAIIATGSTPALACRAALDAKGRADGS